METAAKLTDGKINLRGNLVIRVAPKKADYILYINANNPIAVVEAKDNSHTVGFGLQQSMTYAQMLDIPFAYSSNSDGFVEHDFLTGKERGFGLDQFAVNRTVDTIARGQDRLLLVMATGTGKTYTAFQIVYRLLQTGMKHKILYLADRNILVDQSIQQDFAPLEKVRMIQSINIFPPVAGTPCATTDRTDWMVCRT